MLKSNSKHTRIKLCEFESLDPAYECCALPIDALGFHIFLHQPLDEKIRKFSEIFQYLPPGVEKVLLTDLTFVEAVKAVNALRVDAVQLYPDWEPAQIAAFRNEIPSGTTIIKLISARPEENVIPDFDELFSMYDGGVDAYLLDSYRIGGTGKAADFSHCARIVQKTKKPVFLAGGLTAENVAEAIRIVRPFGVDVENGVSTRIPGGPLVKNMAKCRRFVEAVRTADEGIGRR